VINASRPYTINNRRYVLFRGEDAHEPSEHITDCSALGTDQERYLCGGFTGGETEFDNDSFGPFGSVWPLAGSF
jgi:hypothetical protein